MLADQRPLVIVVMGVSGCGKSTVGRLLADQLGWDFREGDDLHPPSNIAKMSAGVPLTDDDRWPWLDAVAAWVNHHVAVGLPGVMTCSALKHTYRERLAGPGIAFAHLWLPREVLLERVRRRSGHFMPPALLESQLQSLEPLEASEWALALDARTPVATLVTEIVRGLRLAPADA